MRKSVISAVIVCMLAGVNLASAEDIRGIDIEFVTIGHPGNAGTLLHGPWGVGGYYYGAVGYNYRIGMYEVTNEQWEIFTETAGAPTGNNVIDGSGQSVNPYNSGSLYTDSLQPANNISWYESLQFCNYLTSGDKSKGAYQFSGNNANPGDFVGINRAAAISAYGKAYVLPTYDEWDKAAYFKSDGSGFTNYANGTNIAPIAGIETNYNDGSSTEIDVPWDVGTGILEQNGTFDIMGNVGEWNERSFNPLYPKSRIAGGSFNWFDDAPQMAIAAEYPYLSTYEMAMENENVGFRIAEIVPEPTTILLLSLGGLLLRKHRI